jgi:hypothetical protein
MLSSLKVNKLSMIMFKYHIIFKKELLIKSNGKSGILVKYQNQRNKMI